MFKEEMYRLMYRKEDTKIEGTYDRARSTTGNLNLLISEGLRSNKVFEKEISDILKSIDKRLGGRIGENGIMGLKKFIWAEFNAL